MSTPLRLIPAVGYTFVKGTYRVRGTQGTLIRHFPEGWVLTAGEQSLAQDSLTQEQTQ
jgi:hypothetical protein